MVFFLSSLDYSVEDVTVIGGLFAVQLVYGAYTVLMGGLLATGINALFLVSCSGFAVALLFGPIAYLKEKSKRPSMLNLRLLLQFVLIAVGGTVGFQILMLMGIQKTSPTLASAMPNLAPGIIFAIACIFRFEKVDFKSVYSMAKIVGTLVCLAGAMAMSFLQGPLASHTLKATVSTMSLSRPPLDDWVVGCMYLVTAVFMLSCVTILQAATLVEYPAPLSLSAITSLFGSIFTVILAFLQDGKFDAGSTTLSPLYITALAIIGGFTNGICFSFQAWCIKKRGPVFVSVFSPISTVFSFTLSTIYLGESLHLGSLVGVTLIFTGLFFVLWGKMKEEYVLLGDDDESLLLESQEQKKPLLS